MTGSIKYADNKALNSNMIERCNLCRAGSQKPKYFSFEWKVDFGMAGVWLTNTENQHEKRINEINSMPSRHCSSIAANFLTFIFSSFCLCWLELCVPSSTWLMLIHAARSLLLLFGYSRTLMLWSLRWCRHHCCSGCYGLMGFRSRELFFDLVNFSFVAAIATCCILACEYDT